MSKPLKKLLFIDDDQDILTIAKYSLENLKDIEIKFLSSGEEALKEAPTFQPDLIILDMMMPKMDGIATMNAIHLIPHLSKVPIIFITAKGQKQEIEQYYKLGVTDVIMKPFDPLTLGDLILCIWENFQAQKQ